MNNYYLILNYINKLNTTKNCPNNSSRIVNVHSSPVCDLALNFMCKASSQLLALIRPHFKQRFTLDEEACWILLLHLRHFQCLSNCSTASISFRRTVLSVDSSEGHSSTEMISRLSSLIGVILIRGVVDIFFFFDQIFTRTLVSL